MHVQTTWLSSQSPTDDGSSDLPLLALTPSSIASSSLLTVRGRLNNEEVVILIDGGAKGSFVSDQLVRKIGLRVDPSSSWSLSVADGRRHNSFIVPQCTLEVENYRTNRNLMSAPLVFDVILGKDWLAETNPSIDWRTNSLTFTSPDGHQHQWTALDSPMALGPPLSAKQFQRRLRKKETKAFICVIKDVEEFHQALDQATLGKPDYLRNVLLEHEEVFSGVTGLPPSRPHDHRIELVPGSKPPWQPTYHMSPRELELLRDELSRLMELGHIQRSTSPYGAPVFFVQEKTGKIRMVTDYRALNKITVKNRTALPNITELLDRLQDASIFTKIDLQSGFHLIRMAPEDIHKTAFHTKYGHFEFTVMPFGLCNAPATFQSSMNDIFREHLDKSVIVYLDDLLVYSRSHEEHEEHLRQVLGLMRQHQLRARVHKCRFLQEEVDYLGYIVGKGKISADPERLSAISTWPAPKDIHELRSFLGMANTLLRFTPHFAEHASPLTDLLRGSPGKRDPLTWTPAHQTAFDSLKAILISPKTLFIPADDLPIILHTDWSLKAIGGWISQEVNNEICPIAYESRKLRAAERNYSPYDGELLALIHCLRIFRPYLHGRKVIVKTDQKALNWLLTQRTLSRRQQRWLDILMDYDLELEWIAGSKNTIADALSRRRHDVDAGIQVNVINDPASPINLIEEVRRELPNDPSLVSILMRLRNEIPTPPSEHTRMNRYTLRDGLLWFENTRLVVPKALHLKLLREHHDTALAGHPSWTVTYAHLAHSYFWPRMSRDVRQYVRSCDECQRMKDDTHRPYGLLQPLAVPDRPGTSISMDFIVHLPQTPAGYDSITVFVDRLTKMVHLVPGHSTDTALEVAQQFFNTIFRLHGLPSEIVSDRGSVFTSNFWTELMKMLDTGLATSTAFHPQMDGQTDRTNRTLEQMLRFWVDYKQTNWDTLLPIVEFSINNHRSASTGFTPFYLNYGQHPRTPSNAALSSLVPSSQHSLEELRSTLTLVKDLLRSAQDRQAAFANSHRQEKTFQVGDLVLLSSENLTPDNQRGRPSQKLSPRFIGPYPIEQRIGQVAYRLTLPPDLPVHPTFHVSRLRPYRDPLSFHPDRPVPPRPPPDIIEDNPEWEVERILDRRFRGRGRSRRPQYLVHWAGYPDSDDSWQPLRNLGNSLDMIRDFEATLPPDERYAFLEGGDV